MEPSFLLIHIVDSTFPHQPKAGGFETTDCLECLQILNILYMAGGSTLKLEIGHCALYQDMVFQNGKRVTCFYQLSHGILAVVERQLISHTFPYSNIEESTIPRQLLAGGEMTTSCHFCLQILNALHMAGGRNNKGLLLRGANLPVQKFEEFPY